MGENRFYKKTESEKAASGKTASGKADWKKQAVKGLVSMILITASLLLLFAAEKSAAFAQWYCRYIYRGLVEVFGRIFSVFPFSAAEIGLYLLVIGLTAGLLVSLAKLIVRPKKLLTLAKAGSSFLLVVSVLLFTFTLGCGINYKKDAFSKQNSLFTFEYTKEELINLSRSLTADVNKWAKKVDRNAGGITLEAPDLKQEAVTAMKKLSETYEDLKGYYPIPKNLLFSDLLSVQKTSGIYSPFTIEANYNNDMVPFNLPFTACHELSHLRGYMLED